MSEEKRVYQQAHYVWLALRLGMVALILWCVAKADWSSALILFALMELVRVIREAQE